MTSDSQKICLALAGLAILLFSLGFLKRPDRGSELADSTHPAEGMTDSGRTTDIDTGIHHVGTKSRSGYITRNQPEMPRSASKTGVVDLAQRIDRFVYHFRNGKAEGVSFDIDLLGEKYRLVLTEFERVPGASGAGVFFGSVEGEPHSRVSWAFHGDAEVGEIQIHGSDTLKVFPTGEGREHRVEAWEPVGLQRCAICLAVGR